MTDRAIIRGKWLLTRDHGGCNACSDPFQSQPLHVLEVGVGSANEGGGSYVQCVRLCENHVRVLQAVLKDKLP